ncbi:zinc ribbon domain-containing protein [Streptomyces sp. GC420]|uniref:zinc ribbon domain-containing protein n=1 Tax=Streptomyces sp. GC420 TaxID=2697568 RepID=UPI0014150885|nr:transposase [Streptomyces sp. GC420]
MIVTLVVQIRLLPTPVQAAALEATLRARFACRSCGFVDHADRNGSRNIRARAWEL